MGASGHDCALTKRARGNKTSVGVSGIGDAAQDYFLGNHHSNFQQAVSTQWFIVPTISPGQHVIRSYKASLVI